MQNAEQIDYWNGEAGERWAKQDDMMARILEPIAQTLLAHTELDGCEAALDIGCGGGSQSALLGLKLGSEATVTGVDISAPLLAVARDRANSAPEASARLEFLQADASGHAFAADSFDLVFSRFGVMFFDDPVAAFSNIRSGLRPSARVLFSCWQSLQQNAWLWEPLQAALQILPAPEAPPPDAPGPFAFADPERVQSILTEAGFAEVVATASTVSLCFDGASTLRDNARDLIQIGPINTLLEGQDAAVREEVTDRVAEALTPYFKEGALHLPGAIWMVTAVAA
ncbi:MAG: class I SAM-dependent methyltransferase [Halieaceae bacterium]